MRYAIDKGIQVAEKERMGAAAAAMQLMSLNQECLEIVGAPAKMGDVTVTASLATGRILV